MFLTVIRTLWVKRKLVSIVAAVVITSSTVGFTVYKVMADEPEPEVAMVVKNSVSTDSKVVIKDVITGIAEQKGSIDGYRNDEYTYDYTCDETSESIRYDENDGWFKDKWKAAGRYFKGKVYNVKLGAVVEIGYNLEDITVKKITDTRYLIVVKNLEANFNPIIDGMDADDGIFVERTEEERRLIQNDAIAQGKVVLAQDKEELHKAFEYTNQVFKDLMYTNQDIAEQKVQFEFELLSDELVFVEREHDDEDTIIYEQETSKTEQVEEETK